MYDFLFYPPTPVNVMPGVGCDKVPAHREIADHYHGVTVLLAPRWRVCICKDNIQWILQKRSSKHLNKGRWIGKSYCTTRDALIRVCSELGLLSDPKARAVLEALPARISDYRK